MGYRYELRFSGSGGHRLCTGCGIPPIVRLILRSTWKIPWIHSAFGNAAATISGIETAYRSLKKQGKIQEDRNIKFVAFCGDGGT